MLTRKELTAWTDALRSGEYLQGTRSLLKYNREEGDLRYCCLGVLCEVMGLESGQSKEVQVAYCFGTDKDVAFLPESLRDKSGLTGLGYFSPMNMPYLKGNHSLACANDHGVSFAEIADHLDKYYPCVD